MVHRKWSAVMTQSQIPGNETHIKEWTKDEIAAQIAGNGNHTKSAGDFQAWWRTIQSRKGWHIGKGYTISAKGGGGWTITFTDDDNTAMSTSA